MSVICLPWVIFYLLSLQVWTDMYQMNWRKGTGVANISVTTSELVNILSYVEEMPFQFGIFNCRRPKKFLSTDLGSSFCSCNATLKATPNFYKVILYFNSRNTWQTGYALIRPQKWKLLFVHKCRPKTENNMGKVFVLNFNSSSSAFFLYIRSIDEKCFDRFLEQKDSPK